MLDAGFFTAFVLSFFLEQDLDVLCPSGRAFDEASMTRGRRKPDSLFLKSELPYDEERDAYVCPARHLLVLEHSSRDANGAYQRYRGESCGSRPLKAQCTKAEARTLKRYASDDVEDAMAEVMRQPQARARFRRRSRGERPFAGVKGRQGLTRFHRRGLRGARLESVLHFAAWNVRLAIGGVALAQIEVWEREEGAAGPSWRKLGVICVIVGWTR